MSETPEEVVVAPEVEQPEAETIVETIADPGHVEHQAPALDGPPW